MKRIRKVPKTVEKVVEKVVEMADEVDPNDMPAFDSLLGHNVVLLCMNYFYFGRLTGINSAEVELTDPHLIYETGDWSANTWKDAQKLPTEKLCICRASIESFFSRD